jgi:hypothetical protein
MQADEYESLTFVLGSADINLSLPSTIGDPATIDGYERALY